MVDDAVGTHHRQWDWDSCAKYGRQENLAFPPCHNQHSGIQRHIPRGCDRQHPGGHARNSDGSPIDDQQTQPYDQMMKEEQQQMLVV